MTRQPEGQPTSFPLEGKYCDLKDGFKSLQRIVKRNVRQLEDFSNFQGKVAITVEKFLKDNPLGQDMLKAYKTMEREERGSLSVACRMGLDYYLKEKEGIELDKKEISIREKLWDVYDGEFRGRSSIFVDDDWLGYVQYCGIGYDEKTKEEAKTELARKQIISSEKLVVNYKTHGLARIKVLLNQRYFTIDGPIIIDMQHFADPKPKYVWIGHQGLESLTVFVSSGKQKPPEDCGVIDPSDNLEGFILVFGYKGNPNSQIPYRPCLFFVYSPKNVS